MLAVGIPNRESVTGLYLKDRLGTDKVRISENPSTLVIGAATARAMSSHRRLSSTRSLESLPHAAEENSRSSIAMGTLKFRSFISGNAF